MSKNRSFWQRIKAVFGLMSEEGGDSVGKITGATQADSGEAVIEDQPKQDGEGYPTQSRLHTAHECFAKIETTPVDCSASLVKEFPQEQSLNKTGDQVSAEAPNCIEPLNANLTDADCPLDVGVLPEDCIVGIFQHPYHKWDKNAKTSASPAIELVIGIDFGTSCSKVVIGDPSWRNRSYPVRFGNGSDSIVEYLLPTRLNEENNLKMRLMDNMESTALKDIVACYLAGIISRSCEYFWKSGPVEYQSKNIRWSLNLGFPRKSEADFQNLGKVYREIAYVAVRLASQSTSPTPSLAEKIRNNGLRFDPFLPEKRINIYPEIAAQLAGYITSAQRPSGPLLLMDVGAGTLDVSTLILHEDLGDQVLSFHCCDVRDLGILRYYARIVSSLNEYCPGSSIYPMEYYQDGLRAIPEQLEKIAHFVNPSIKATFANAKEGFRMDVLNQALGSLWKFRSRLKAANANQSQDPWGKSLRVFLTGGGSRSRFFMDCLGTELEQEIAKRARCWDDNPARRKRLGQGFRIEQMPIPSSSVFPGFPQHLKRDFDRLSVAYGLAFGGQNLMRITSTVNE